MCGAVAGSLRDVTDRRQSTDAILSDSGRHRGVAGRSRRPCDGGRRPGGDPRRGPQDLRPEAIVRRDRRRPARVRREPRAGGARQVAAAARARIRASSCTSSGRCSRTRRARRWRCSTPSIRSTGRASPRRSPRRSSGRAAAPRLFVEVNTGAEPQKAGVLPEEADAFVAAAATTYGLADRRPDVHPAGRRGAGAAFRPHRQDRRRATGLQLLSMGMSADFEIAIRFGATHVRVGSAIFGHRGP